MTETHTHSGRMDTAGLDDRVDLMHRATAPPSGYVNTAEQVRVKLFVDMSADAFSSAISGEPGTS